MYENVTESLRAEVKRLQDLKDETEILSPGVIANEKTKRVRNKKKTSAASISIAHYGNLTRIDTELNHKIINKVFEQFQDPRLSDQYDVIDVISTIGKKLITREFKREKLGTRENESEWLDWTNKKF